MTFRVLRMAYALQFSVLTATQVSYLEGWVGLRIEAPNPFLYSGHGGATLTPSWDPVLLYKAGCLLSGFAAQNRRMGR